MLRKEHKKKYQADHDKDERLERKTFRKNRSRERMRPNQDAEPYEEE